MISWCRKWQPTPVFLPGESHGQGSLVGYSSWGGHKRVGHNWTTATAKEVQACLSFQTEGQVDKAGKPHRVLTAHQPCRLEKGAVFNKREKRLKQRGVSVWVWRCWVMRASLLPVPATCSGDSLEARAPLGTLTQWVFCAIRVKDLKCFI